MAKHVTITVDSNDNVSADPDQLDVGKSNGSVIINFDMGTSGREITGVSGLPDAEFTEKGKNGNGWKVKDKNDNTETYDYTVQVQPTQGGNVLQLDPSIKNGGQG